uniref:Uncharacterized protein n=1 Tax=Geobacter sp. (strain M21) TaxID=443144 RepID=C6E2X7_GEOSM
MKIICPNCHHRHRGHTPQSTITPFSLVCARCSTEFLVNWKIRLAGKTDDTVVVCSWCAAKQQDSDRCQCCGRPFYDYARCRQTPRRAPKISRKRRDENAVQTQRASQEVPETRRVRGRVPSAARWKICILALTAIAVLGFALSSFWHKNSEQQYLTNYVIALYGIRSGLELSGRTCSDIAADWRKDLDAGREVSNEISRKESEDLATVKREIDLVMSKVKPAPEKFGGIGAKLQEMYDIYLEVHTLANMPFGTPKSIMSTVDGSKTGFRLKVQELKQSMPAQLSEEVRKSAVKYDLSFLQ